MGFLTLSWPIGCDWYSTANIGPLMHPKTQKRFLLRFSEYTYINWLLRKPQLARQPVRTEGSQINSIVYHV